jgi:DNA-binding MarR family transcriptional regulator
VAEPQWLDAREERAWRQYRRMNRLLYSRLAQDMLRDSGLSDADYEVLSNLTESEGHALRASDLATRLQWSSSRLAHHVGRMERRGLVRRDSCDTDARGAVVRLTRAGLRAIQRAAPDHVASVRRHFVDRLTPAQLDVLDEIATTVVAHLVRGASEE